MQQSATVDEGVVADSQVTEVNTEAETSSPAPEEKPETTGDAGASEPEAETGLDPLAELMGDAPVSEAN